MFGILFRIMKNILCLFLALFVGAQLCATNQIPDLLLHNGMEYDIDVNPLEPYFKKHPGKHPKKYSYVISTALSRGYIATFEIKDKQLFVKEINVKISFSTIDDDGTTNVFNKVFADTNEVKAVWFTGITATPGMRIERSSITNEASIKIENARGRDIYQGGDGNYYEQVKINRLVLEFEQGNLVSERSMSAKEYSAFVKTSKYKTVRKKMEQEGYDFVYLWE